MQEHKLSIVHESVQVLPYLVNVLLARYVDHVKDRLQRPQFVFVERYEFAFAPVESRQTAVRSSRLIVGFLQGVVLASSTHAALAHGPFSLVEVVRDESLVVRGEEATGLLYVTGVLNEDNVRVDVFRMVEIVLCLSAIESVPRM